MTDGKAADYFPRFGRWQAKLGLPALGGLFEHITAIWKVRDFEQGFDGSGFSGWRG